MILGTPTMEDAQRLRQVYLIAMAQHELDVLKLNIAEHIEGTRLQRKKTRKWLSFAGRTPVRSPTLCACHLKCTMRSLSVSEAD